MRNKTHLFCYLLIITAVFILIEISYVLIYSGIFFGDYQYITGQIKIPLVAVPDIVYFILAQLALHISLAVFALVIGCSCANFFSLSWKTTEKLALLILLSLFIEAILLNQLWFPNSKFSSLSEFVFTPSVFKIFLVINSSFLLISAFFAVLKLFKYRRGATCLRHPGIFNVLKNFLDPAHKARDDVSGDTAHKAREDVSKKNLWRLGQLSLLLIPFFYFFHKPVITDGATPSQPNIIIIGIDAVRPDFLGFYNNKHHSPHLDNFLKNAVVFDNALTPLARTFPAWISILSGQYPKVNNIRTDLVNASRLNKKTLLSAELQQAGYETIFAMDETRFSNIDKSFGFDKIITPRMGLNDFLLGTLNDFPISNLVINTLLGKWLFPYNYANRATFINYDPNTFIKLVESNLLSSRSKPVFLAIHFCLPHYPYLWRNFKDITITINTYEKSIWRVDQQFNDFLTVLNKAKLLENSVVIVLSDHGEGLELPGDRVTEKNLYLNKNNKTIPHFFSDMVNNEEVNRSAGHGTDVLGIPQYHSLLALRYYGKTFLPKHILERVSLLDIKPTIQSVAKISTHENLNGYSLGMYVWDDNFKRPLSHFFIESDFSPSAIHTIHPEIKTILMQGMMYFQVDKNTGHVEVKPTMEKLIIASKQFADFYGDWVLAFYPQSNHEVISILVNLKTGHWTDDLNSSFAKSAPTLDMLAASKNFFANDLK